MRLEPCSDCPFRSDRPFRGLSKKRCEEIVDTLYRDGGFHCHKTLDYSSGNPVVTQNSKLCTGSAIFLENTRRGGMRANIAYRLEIAYRGLRTEHLMRNIPVYTSVRDFIRGASVGRTTFSKIRGK